MGACSNTNWTWTSWYDENHIGLKRELPNYIRMWYVELGHQLEEAGWSFSALFLTATHYLDLATYLIVLALSDLLLIVKDILIGITLATNALFKQFILLFILVLSSHKRKQLPIPHAYVTNNLMSSTQSCIRPLFTWIRVLVFFLSFINDRTWTSRVNVICSFLLLAITNHSSLISASITASGWS